MGSHLDRFLEARCPRCKGASVIFPSMEPCPECHGTGEVSHGQQAREPGTSGQDRENYSDTQDRENYAIDPDLASEEPEEEPSDPKHNSHCPNCNEDTGHTEDGDYYTCDNCGHTDDGNGNSAATEWDDMDLEDRYRWLKRRGGNLDNADAGWCDLDGETQNDLDDIWKRHGSL